MQKKMSESDTEINNVKVDFIKDDMTNLKKTMTSKDNADKIEMMNKIADIAELILYFNNEINWLINFNTKPNAQQNINFLSSIESRK